MPQIRTTAECLSQPDNLEYPTHRLLQSVYKSPSERHLLPILYPHHTLAISLKVVKRGVFVLSPYCNHGNRIQTAFPALHPGE